VPQYGADSVSYYAYLRSAVFDRDWDFTNEWKAWGYPALGVTETGHRRNPNSVGPALLWTPFFLATHGYVLANRALGRTVYAADGVSEPYRRSLTLGTLTVATLGAFLLARVLAARVGKGAARLAVVAAVTTSPVLYYLFVQSAMSHGCVFGVASAVLWAWERARRAPSRRAWLELAALVGLLTLVRWQAVVYLLFVLPLLAVGLARKTVRWAWAAQGAVVGLAVFSPQILAWQVLYGRPVTVPYGFAAPGHRSYFSWASPHAWDVLLSADRGFFAWTPAMLLGVVGLLLSLRRFGLLSAGGLLVFAASTWINGSVLDWSGADSFGARRFDLVVPFIAVGFAWLLSAAARRPLVAPVLIVAGLALWNAGLVGLYRRAVFSEAAPLERVAARQARGLRTGAESWLEKVAGPRGRALAYKLFVGEFLYWNLNLSGTLDLAGADEHYLAGGWSPPRNRSGPPTFRQALYPQACVRLPLDEPLRPLPAVITLRAPERLPQQTVTIVLNGHVLKQGGLGPEWQDVSVTLPAERLHTGENLLCLRFSGALPSEDGSAVAAAVSRIQLP